MKQTAVQMLISRLPNIDWSDPYYSDILNEAVDKEREQIVDAANLPKDKRWYDAKKYANCGEQYYNKTYKSE